MPEICTYKCSSCGFAVASDLSGGMYAIDDKGAWVACLHPGEFTTAAEVLGITNAELSQALLWRDSALGSETIAKPLSREAWVHERVASRLKFKAGCCCFNCGAHSEIDTSSPSRSCPFCGSSELHTPVESLGRRCPKCHEGTIRQVGTGIHI